MSPRTESHLSTPPGVVVTRDHFQLPRYGPDPSVRSPLRRSGDLVEFVLLEQSTIGGQDEVLTVPDVLAINGDTQIGFARASRIMQAGQTTGETKKHEGRCSLCADTNQPGDRRALEVNNSRPFGPLLHKVIFSRVHINALQQVGLDEVRDSTEQFFQIAEGARNTFGDSVDGLAIGMNFGEYVRCGASQIHFHYQLTGLGPANYNPGDRLGVLCRAYRQNHAGSDYLTDYELALRQADLVVAEARNRRAFAYAPISPRFKGEVQIMLARRQHGNQPGHILETTPDERDALAELQHEIMSRLGRLGCEALNQVWYMSRFSADKDWGQRLIISVCPRTSIIAFYELFGNSVIDTVPWKSAQTIRAAEQLHFNLRP